MNKQFIIFIAIICLVSCKKEQINTDVKLVAIDEFVKDAQLFIDGHFVENFSHLNELEAIEPCISLSDSFPSISLNSSPTSVGKSFYDFLIISNDYKFQQTGTKVVEDGVCQKWELKTRHLKPVIDDRFDVQGVVKMSAQDVLVKIFENKNEDAVGVKIILNGSELVSNYVSSGTDWEQNVSLREGMNFLAIEYVDSGVFSEIPVVSNIEIIDGNELHSFEIQSYLGEPGAFLIACHKKM